MARKAIWRNLVLLLFLVSTYTFAQHESKQMKNRRALVQMEHDFAKAAAEKGTRAAFLEFLADDGILFQPGAMNGREYWTKREPRKGLLSWEPAFADVSNAGDLGYTTGPWEFRPNGPDDKPIAFGQYFTIWKKQTDGTWKVALDRGVSTDRPFPSKVLILPTYDAKGEVSTFNVKDNRAQLLKLERKFSNDAQRGTLAAFNSYFDYNVRVLRQNTEPLVGKDQAFVFISANNDRLAWQATAADISKSGDLGYTYGTFESTNRATTERGSFVRVWKNQYGKWKVVVDVMSPDPKE